ncbi:MAG: aspartate aminotransferase family protein [Erysipelotrichaceae bacterium]
MKFEEIKKNDQEYVMNTYGRFDIALEHGKGAKVYDYDNKEYIDCGSGIGVNSLGYANELWVKAVCEQAGKIAHTSNLYYTSQCGQVAKKLCDRTGGKKVFFANSGAEANEGAIKTARKYSSDKYGENRFEIITLVNSFHGRTITTLSSTGQDVFHKNFNPFTRGFVYAEANNLDSVNEMMNDKTCAVLIELVQGEGGVIALDKEFVQGLYKLCKEKDILLIVDEVQTGIGRTGALLTYQRYEIQPDIVTMAKGLGGGLPIGAFMVFDKCEKTLGKSDHGTTFGGNPIVCAGANVVLDVIDEAFVKEVIKKGEYINAKVVKMPHVLGVSGLGLMIGVEFDETTVAIDVVKKCMEQGAIFLTAKSKLRMLPPLVITYEEIDQALQILENVLKGA